MSWKTWPYWLKGGIIFGLIALILVGLLFSKINIFSGISFFFLLALYFILSLFFTEAFGNGCFDVGGSGVCNNFLLFTSLIIEAFIIGALIGMLYQFLRKK